MVGLFLLSLPEGAINIFRWFILELSGVTSSLAKPEFCHKAESCELWYFKVKLLARSAMREDNSAKTEQSGREQASFTDNRDTRR